MKKYINEITNVAGLVAIIAGAIIAAPVVGPTLVVAKIALSASIGIIGYFTGKKHKE